MFRIFGIAMRLFVVLLLVLAATTFMSGHWAANAQTAKELRQKVNANTVTVLSGNPNGTYLFIASDIAFVLDDGDNLRVLPVVGKGGAQNVRDLIYLRGIDMAIVRSDALAAFSGDPRYRNIGWQLRYVTRLYNEEMHIMARNDITSIDQLNGARVNLSDKGSGTQLTSQIIFSKLGIKPVEYNMGQRDGFEKLKAGELDATILVAGKPSGSWKSVEIDRSRFHILTVPWS
ncbi:MAG: TAXI family TRAP transporter solute-binding subunit [Alphaproteobacteria bacterium]